MKALLVTTSIILALSGCASFTKQQAYNTALMVADWGQTRHIAENPDYYETNKILGKYPTREAVDLYFLTLIGSYHLIHNIDFIDHRYKKAMDWYVTIMWTHTVWHNHSIGIEIDF